VNWRQRQIRMEREGGKKESAGSLPNLFRNSYDPRVWEEISGGRLWDIKKTGENYHPGGSRNSEGLLTRQESYGNPWLRRRHQHLAVVGLFRSRGKGPEVLGGVDFLKGKGRKHSGA